MKQAISGFRKTVQIVEKKTLCGKTVKVKKLKDLGEISTKSKNYYLQAVQHFCRWMVQDQRAGESPVEHLNRLRLPEDEHRRALSFEEVPRLLEATEKAQTRFGMTGHERAVLYLLAVECGLRVRELQSLTISSFDFMECTVTVKAEFCKDRKKAEQLLKNKRAPQLQEFFADKTPKVKAFNMPSNYRTAEMLKADLTEAGIPYEDMAGRKADFHCLRHTLATALDKTGASLKERMDIMRHSDKSNLTLGTYTHVRIYDLRRAIENLPDYLWPGTQKNKAVATGTDDKAFSTEPPLTGKRTGKWTGTAYPDSFSMSSDSTAKSQQEHLGASTVETPKPLKVACLGTKKDLLSPPDIGEKTTGPGRIRTYDQWIMSPLL